MINKNFDLRDKHFSHLNFFSKEFIHFNFQLSEILNATRTYRTFASQYIPDTGFSRFGLLMRKWILLQPISRNYRHEQWMHSWDDSTWTTRWEKTCRFFWSSEITKSDQYKRVACSFGGAAIGGLTLGGSLYGVSAYYAVTAGAATEAAASISFSSSPGTIAVAVGAVVGTAGGMMAGDVFWSRMAMQTKEYQTWKETMAKLELRDLVKRDPRTNVISNHYKCCISHQQIDVKLDLSRTFDDWVEDRTGHLYHTKALVLAHFERNQFSEVTVRHSKSKSVILDDKFDQNCEGSVEVTLQPADRLINLTTIPDEDCAPMLNSLTMLPAYRAIYMTLCRQLFVLRQGFAVDKISDESLQLAQKQLESSLAAKLLEIKIKAIEQIHAMVAIVSNAFELTFKQAETIRRDLLRELKQADAGDRLVIFTPLLKLRYPHDFHKNPSQLNEK